MLVYRITHKKYTDHLFAPGLAGRWNSGNRKVLYCAESISLALIESMVRRQGVGFNRDYNIIIIEVPDKLKIQSVDLISLPVGWRNFRNYSICQGIGNEWFDRSDIPLLKVPSAVITQSFNYVINAQHSDYKFINVAEVTELVPDERIDELLRRHRS